MAEIIKVSTPEMQSTLNTYNTQKGAQSTAYQNMNTSINNLSSVWEGQAASAFRQRFQEFYRNLSMSEEKMQDCIDELRKSMGIYEEAENATNTASGNLDIGTSPFSV